MSKFLKIDRVEWKDCTEGKRTKLLAAIEILGCPMHLEAFEVTENSDGVQESTDFDFENDLSTIAAGVHVDGPWTEVLIEGRRYVLIATPYC